MSEWNRGYDRERYGRDDENAYYAEPRGEGRSGERRDFGREEGGAGGGYGGRRGMFRGQGGYEGQRFSGGQGYGRSEYGGEAYGTGTARGYGGGYGSQGYEGRGQGSQGYGFQGYGAQTDGDSYAAQYGRYGAEQASAMGRHRGKGPKNYTRSDSRIAEDVNDRLSDDSWIDASEVDVQVKDGEVTLTGTVQTRQDKRRAEDLAENCSGVKNVQNNLRVTSPQAGDATPAARSSSQAGGQSGATRQ